MPLYPKIRLIAVGDEILSGRRQDKHFPKLIELLTERGMALASAEFVGDARADIAAVLTRSFATDDVVFCCGGIGATPDDQTRQAAAEALGLPLALHAEAARLIAERCAEMAAKGQGSADMTIAENQQRLQMGVFPQGAEIVPNPYNKIPGFFIREHTFMPGFPVMAWPMMAWTLDTRYPHLHHREPHAEYAFLVFHMPESRITPALEALEQRWPGVKAFSLPSMGEDGHKPYIDLGVKGEPQAAQAALDYLKSEVLRLGGVVQEGSPPRLAL